MVRLVPQERVQWFDQHVEVLIPQSSEDSEQIVDVVVSQEDLFEALQLQVFPIFHKFQRKRPDVEFDERESL